MSKLFTVTFDCGHKLYLTEEEVEMYPVGAEFENGESCSECDTHKSIVVDTTYIGIERPGVNVVDLTARRSEAAFNEQAARRVEDHVASAFASAQAPTHPTMRPGRSMYCIIVQRPNNATPLVSPIEDCYTITKAREALEAMAKSTVQMQQVGVGTSETIGWAYDETNEHVAYVYTFNKLRNVYFNNSAKTTTLTIGRITNPQ